MVPVEQRVVAVVVVKAVRVEQPASPAVHWAVVKAASVLLAVKDSEVVRAASVVPVASSESVASVVKEQVLGLEEQVLVPEQLRPAAPASACFR